MAGTNENPLSADDCRQDPIYTNLILAWQVSRQHTILVIFLLPSISTCMLVPYYDISVVDDGVALVLES